MFISQNIKKGLKQILKVEDINPEEKWERIKYKHIKQDDRGQAKCTSYDNKFKWFPH